MPRLTTGPIENTGNQPDNATFSRVKVLNHSSTTVLNGTIRAYRLNGSKVLTKAVKFSVPPNSSNFFDLTLIRKDLYPFTFQYEVLIQTSQQDGVFSVYGYTENGQLIPAQRVVNSELTPL